MRRIFLASLFAAPLGAQTTALDSACYRPLKAAVDSLGKLHLTRTIPTKYQTRAVATLTQAHTLYCTRTTTSPPAPARTLTLTADSPVLRERPTLPYYVFVTARSDSAGVVSDSAAFTASDTSLATLWWNRTARRLEVYNARKAGTLLVVGQRGAARDTVAIRIEVNPVVPPPDTTLSRIDVTFDHTTTTLWPVGAIATFPPSGDAVLCARVDVGGTAYLGTSAVLATAVRHDSLTWRVLPDTGAAVRQRCATHGITGAFWPVTWSSVRVQLAPGDTLRWPVPLAAPVVP